MEAEVLQLTPSLCFLSITAAGSPAASHKRQPWNEHRALSTPSPQPGPPCFRWGTCGKDQGELLMIQRAFSSDAFGRRGLQVSTWFGFGLPPPFS